MTSAPMEPLVAYALVAKDITRRVGVTLLVLVTPFQTFAISEVAVEEPLTGLLATILGLLEAGAILARGAISTHFATCTTVGLVGVRVDAFLSTTFSHGTLQGGHVVGGHVW